MITPIPSYYIAPIWSKVEGHIKSAIEHVDTGYLSDDILKCLMMSDMQLWVINEYQAACVTQILVYPQHKSCVVVALGGQGIDEWFDELMDKIEDWASKMECKYVEEYGRKGWLKIGQKRGFEHVYTVMRKKV